MTTPDPKPVTLTRQLRFGLEPGASTSTPAEANGYAANPPLTSLAPFLCLTAAVKGHIDPHTGMLVNIKIVDRILRDHAVPILREAVGGSTTTAANPTLLLPRLFHTLTPHFTPHQLTSLTLEPSPYLAFAVHQQEPTMVHLTQKFDFSAAHRLHADTLSHQENLDLFGRCNNPNGHGHNYVLEVTVSGTPHPTHGSLLPIPLLQRLVNQHIIDPFDHKHLNLDCDDFRAPHGLNPTVENIAKTLFHRLHPHIPAPARLTSIRLWETPKTMCEYTE